MNTNKGFKRLKNAFYYSVDGFKDTYKTEEGFRQEVIAFIALFPLSFFVASNPIEWLLLICSILLVMVVEILNTAVEATVDKFEQQHPMFKKAKDAGSAAVALSITIATIIWLVIWIT